MTYAFLLINLFLLLIPAALAFDRQNFKAIGFKFMIPAVLITGIIFSAFAVFFSLFRIWSFNEAYLMGISYRDLPLEQYLFSFTFSFAALSIYAYLNARYPNNHLQKFSLSVSNLMIGVCVAFIFFAYAKWYTAITFSVLLLLLLYIEYLNKLRFMYRFYRAYLVSLIPFYICFWFISNLPIITYNNLETVKLRLFAIPLENHFYMMAMILLATYLQEMFKNKVTQHGLS